MEDLKFTWLKNGDMIDSVEEREFEEDIEIKIVKANGGEITLHFKNEKEVQVWFKKWEAPEIEDLDEITA